MDIQLTDLQQIHVRRFYDTDAAQCCAIINACLPKMEGLNADAVKYVLGKNIPEILSTELCAYYTLVCVNDSTILGLGSLDGSEIKRMYVHPEVQGQGTGTLLLKHLEAEATRRRVSKLQLQSSPSAERFYSQNGYERVKTETLSIGFVLFHVIDMEKCL